MPLAAIVGGKIFCVHAGLGPELEDLKQINDIIRPTRVPEEGLLYDLLWKEIDNNNEEYESQTVESNHLFGKKVVDHFLRKNGLELICRSHQLTEKGYEYFAEGKLVTIFSVPSYLGVFDNLGSMMIVDESLTISFHVIDKKNIRI